MKRKGKKWFDDMRRHFAGAWVVLVLTVMAIVVVRGAAGGETDFEPWEVDPAFSSSYYDIPDRTGYDLSGEGEDGREVNKESGEEETEEETEAEETEEESEEAPNLEDESSPFSDREQIVLPNGVTQELKPSETVDVSVRPEGEPSGNLPSVLPGKPEGGTGGSPGGEGPGQEENEPPSGGEKPGDEEHPGGNEEEPGEGEGPSDGGETPKPDPGPPKFSVMIDGQEKEFESEDEALAWVVDNSGKNDEGQYFEGFVKDENGNTVPSYTDKEHLGGNGDISWDYTGESSTYVVPDGTKALDLVMLSNNETIRTIVIPKTVERIVVETGNRFLALEKFVVSGENPHYAGVDGLLYQKEENGAMTLYAVPAAKKTVDTWPENLTVIGESAFYRSKMEQVSLPDTVEEIEDFAFGESAVETILLPESVKTLGSMVFDYQTPKDGENPLSRRILVEAKRPPSVTNATFIRLDYNLEKKLGEPTTKILVPDSVKNQVYEAYLMTWGLALTERYGGEAGLQILNTAENAQEEYECWAEDGKKGYRRKGEESPFFWSDALGVYQADEEGRTVLLTCLATSSFVDLSSLEISSVAEGAFDGCGGMTAIRLPESLERLPEGAFAAAPKLKVVISYGRLPQAEALGVAKSCSVFVKPEALADCQAVWGGQVRKLLGTSEKYSVTTSGLVFDTNSTRLLDIPMDMETLTIPSYVTSVYGGAAAGSTALTKVVVPAGVTNVGAQAFADCTSLSQVSWNTSASVPDSCFEGCLNLKTFGANGAGHNLTSFGARAFYGCNSLGTVLYYSYPSGGMNYYYYYFLERIGEQAFYGCSSMTYAYLHTSVKDLGASAFEGSGLTQAFWYTAAPVSDSCFAGCVSLETVGWGDAGGQVTAVGAKSFYGCHSLRTMLLPQTVEKVGGQAFGGREGRELTLTVQSEVPPAWEEPETPEGLILYVPDSKESGDAVYLAYLEAWKIWLGEHPEKLLKTEDGAHLRIFPAPTEPGETGIKSAESEPETRPAEPEPKQPETKPAESEATEPEARSAESEAAEPETKQAEPTDSVTEPAEPKSVETKSPEMESMEIEGIPEGQ